MTIDILNKTYEPSMNEISNYIENNANKRWLEIVKFIESEFISKPLIFYSKCSAKPGWNIKYKKNNRALCTLYPSKDSFTALVVLNKVDMDLLKGMRQNYSEYVLKLYDSCSLFNGTKWLMINITNDEILNDVKNLLFLKLQ